MRLLTLSLAVGAATLGATALLSQPSVAQKPAAPKQKAASAPAAARNWDGHVTQTPAGAYVIGNPAAKVHLIEYLSYSCGHCAHFVAESKQPLKEDLIRRGQVKVEVRHAVRDPLDLAAALLVRCAGPSGFYAAGEVVFNNQNYWLTRGGRFWQANHTSLQSQPALTRLKALANASGLADLVKTTGMTQARVDQCFATPTDLSRLTTMSDASWKVISGTPSFVINGKPGGGGHWETLAPEIRAAGAN